MSSPYLQRKQSLGAVLALWDVTGTTWTDESGNAHHGTIVGPVSATPPSGSTIPAALKGDGVDDFVRVSHHADLQPTAEVSVDLWMIAGTLVTSPQHQYASWVTKGDNTYQLRQHAIEPRRISFDIRPDSTYYIRNASDVLTADTWHHVVGTYDGANLRLYVDKVQVGATVPRTGDIGTDALSDLIVFAQDNAGTMRRWNDITAAAVSVYPTGLTAAQVGELYDATFEEPAPNNLSATVAGTSTATASATIPSPWTDWVSATTDASPVIEASATAAGSSAASGTSSTVHPLAAAVSGSSAASGTTTAVRGVSGSVASAATASASPSALRDVTATSSGTSSVTAEGSMLRASSASVAGASSASGVATVIIGGEALDVTATLAGTASCTGAVSLLAVAEATSGGAGTATATAGVILAAATSSAVGMSSVSAGGTLLAAAAGAVAGAGSVTGSASATLNVTTSVASTSSLSASASSLRAVVGQGGGMTSISAGGTLLVAADGAVAGAGSVTGSATVILAEIVLSLVRATSTSAELTWTDGGSWDDYLVERDGQIVHVTPLLTFTDTSLEPLTEYAYRVRGRVLQ